MEPPFDPPETYPELPFASKTNKTNLVYAIVRDLLIKLGLDHKNIGCAEWNPFKEIIRPGQNVLVKPNLVTHQHYFGEHALYSTVSHGSILRPLIDYVHVALKGNGSITVADNPVEGADFDRLMKFTGIQEMIDKLSQRGYTNVKVIDLRPKVLKEASNGEFYYENQPGDPLGYVTIDLGKDSLFGEFDNNQNIHFYTLADKTVDHVDPKYCERSKTDDYHNPSMHKYIVSKSILNADTIINVAKMKSHCKAGVSLTLKNMIGIVFEKDCMPHHRPGLPPKGDAFPFYPASHYVMARKSYLNLKKWFQIHRIPVVKAFRDWLQKKKVLVGQQIEHGNWKGNDTIWRTILDLNRINVYADREGKMQDTPQRSCFALIDGIISQQGEGPMAGDAVPTSIILGGFNPVLVDALAVKAMGLDYRLFKTISEAGRLKKWKLLPGDEHDLSFSEVDVPNLKFELSKGWR
ncbi:MAG: DUF362 domain-containing protein [Deltaproteobacteria bacterium]|nr:DUF362 domain-containing protein [Deltaproteobacteria bacterium]